MSSGELVRVPVVSCRAFNISPFRQTMNRRAIGSDLLIRYRLIMNVKLPVRVLGIRCKFIIRGSQKLPFV